MVKVTIKTFKDLVDVFPKMTDSNRIQLYLEVLKRIRYYNDKIGLGTDEEDDYCLDKISFYHEFEDFLGGYLARCFCEVCGYTLGDR